MLTNKKTGAQLLRFALEQLPVAHTFGIPGVHNTEIYDELSQSDLIEPILVTHEGGAAFMADAVSRTSANIGTLLIVPSAGVTHAMSGIAEAYLDGIPMLIISGGVRRDIGKSFQLHQWDQHRFLASATKQTVLIQAHDQIIPCVYEAYDIAVSGKPGPVFIEIPAELQLYKGVVKNMPLYAPKAHDAAPAVEKIEPAVDYLINAQKPGIFAGWGAREAEQQLKDIAELLNAPVATTLQGLSVFPADHPLHTGMGFGAYSVPASANAFKDCDCLLAVGVSFGEIPTGSFGMVVPENLIHVDIDPEVFNKNYPARVVIQGDSVGVLDALLKLLQEKRGAIQSRNHAIREQISRDKAAYFKEWEQLKTDKVNPRLFFSALRKKLDRDAIVVVDDGNHTFLTAELFESHRSKHLILPSDFNCMGYCVPAAIGAKLANPAKQVVGIVGDGAFLMTGMEMLTAAVNNLGIVYFVFHDGELSQIAQGQAIPYNRKTCTILGNIHIKGVAEATGAFFIEIRNNGELETQISQAFEIASKGQPVLVDVTIDYAKQTRFTQGVVKTVFKRFPLGDKVRFIGRSLKRRITG